MLTRRTHTCGALRRDDEGAEVTVQGWASAVRDRGGVTFLVLRDRHGTVQVTADDRATDAVRETAKAVRQEYVVQVTGRVALRSESARKSDMATGDMHPGFTTGREIMADPLTFAEQRGVQVDVLVDRHRAVATIAGPHQPQLSTFLIFRERLLLVPRRQPLLLGEYPDLKKVDRVRFGGIEFAVTHARAGGHPLDVTGPDNRTVAHAVLVLQRTRQDV